MNEIHNIGQYQYMVYNRTDKEKHVLCIKAINYKLLIEYN